MFKLVQRQDLTAWLTTIEIKEKRRWKRLLTEEIIIVSGWTKYGVKLRQNLQSSEVSECSLSI
jgi:hypothetical protein